MRIDLRQRLCPRLAADGKRYRLGKEIHGTRLHRFDSDLYVALTGQHDDARIRIALAHGCNGSKTVHTGKLKVDDDHVRADFGEPPQAFFGGAGERDVPCIALEIALDVTSKNFFVLDESNSASRYTEGNSTTVVPSTLGTLDWMLPPMRSTVRLASASPNPVLLSSS